MSTLFDNPEDEQPTWPYGRPAARTNDPETSHEAAESVQHVRESQAFILGILATVGPLTDEEINREVKRRAVRMSDSGIRTRRSELVTQGRVEDSGLRRTTESGRRTIVWRVK